MNRRSYEEKDNKVTTRKSSSGRSKQNYNAGILRFSKPPNYPPYRTTSKTRQNSKVTIDLMR